MRNALCCFLSALLLIFAGSSRAATAFPDIDIPYEKHVLPNGLTLVIHEDHKAPVVAVNVWYHVGSKDERPGRTGFAHLFEHLMFNGSEHHRDEYFRPLNAAGATKMNGTTWLDRTNYYQNVPTSALDLALWLESDRMGHLLGAIDQKKLDEQRSVVQNEKRQGESQPYGKTDELIAASTYPAGHPYSWLSIGSMEDLNAASLEDVKEWFRTYYGAANAVLVIAGDVNPSEVKQKVEHYFGDIPAGPVLKRQTEWIAKMTGTKRALLQDRVPAAQLIKTWNVPGWSSRDLTLLQLVGKVLTEGKNSRLFKRLVFTDQLAADVQATVGPFEIGSQFQIIALANPGVDIATLERAVDEELAAFLLQGPTPEELERLKSRTYAAQIRALERIDGGSGKAHMLAESQVYGGSPDYYKKSLTWMREATPADLQRVAQQWLSDGVFVLEVHPTPEYATAAAGADRSRLPEPSTPPDLKLPPLTRTTLSNGLEVVLAERHNAPLVQLTLILDAGASADDPAHPGIAGLTLAMLDEGTKTRNALQIADRAEVLGVQFLAASSLDSAYLGMGAITSQLPASVELFSDILINATFPQEDFERARAQALAGIQFSKVQPRGIVSRLVPQLLYGKGHPYANPVAGTEASLKAMTVADLRAFKDRWYRPDNAKLLIVGDTTIEQIKPLLEKYLAAWKTPAAARGKKELAAVALPGKQRIFLVNRTGAEQSTIVAAHVVPPRSDRDFLAFKTFNEILGGMFTSRVNMNLREGKGWAYGASSSLRETQGPGMLSASASVQQDKTAESMVEIARELRDIVGGRKPTAQEIELARDSLVLALPGSNETATEVSNSYSSVLTFGLPDDYWNTYVSGVNALTREQLAAAGARLLQPDSITWLVIGDLAKIEQGVRKLGLGEVQVLDADGNVVR